MFLLMLLTILGIGSMIIFLGIALTIIFSIAGLFIGRCLSRYLTKRLRTKIIKPRLAINRKAFIAASMALPCLLWWLIQPLLPPTTSSWLTGLGIYLLCYLPAATCRAADCGRPWFWSILSLIPFIGIWFWGELLVRKGLPPSPCAPQDDMRKSRIA